jgi:hypothetical protein
MSKLLVVSLQFVLLYFRERGVSSRVPCLTAICPTPILVNTLPVVRYNHTLYSVQTRAVHIQYPRAWCSVPVIIICINISNASGLVLLAVGSGGLLHIIPVT